jgi:hypothetical protein
MKKEIL